MIGVGRRERLFIPFDGGKGGGGGKGRPTTFEKTLKEVFGLSSLCRNAKKGGGGRGGTEGEVANKNGFSCPK